METEIGVTVEYAIFMMIANHVQVQPAFNLNSTTIQKTRGNPFTETLKERGLSCTALALFLNPSLSSIDVVAVHERDVALASRLFRRAMVGVEVSLIVECDNPFLCPASPVTSLRITTLITRLSVREILTSITVNSTLF